MDGEMGKQDLDPRLLLTVCFSLVSHPSLPYEQLLESACWNSGKVMEAEWRLFPIIKEMGDTEKPHSQESHWALHSIIWNFDTWLAEGTYVTSPQWKPQMLSL